MNDARIIELLEQIEQNTRPKSRKAAEPFNKPDISEIAAYIAEKGYSVDAEQFFNFYESKDWFVGKNKMKDWKACLTTWAKRDRPATAKTKLYPITGKTCGRRGCQLPAVYKSGGGDYDNYYCSQHMPDAVKEHFE